MKTVKFTEKEKYFMQSLLCQLIDKIDWKYNQDVKLYELKNPILFTDAEFGLNMINKIFIKFI